LEIGTVSATTVNPSVGLAVEKSGRSTAKTTGKIGSINVTATVSGYGPCGLGTKTAVFVKQFLINSKTFSAAGDSGSLIVTQSPSGTKPKPVGLERVSQVKDRYNGYLLHLPGVVGHGVSLAQDGSGRPVIVLFLKDTRVSVDNFPTTIEGVPVETQVTGEFRTTIKCSHAGAK
jgi:hypothetical protein